MGEKSNAVDVSGTSEFNYTARFRVKNSLISHRLTAGRHFFLRCCSCVDEISTVCNECELLWRWRPLYWCRQSMLAASLCRIRYFPPLWGFRRQIRHQWTGLKKNVIFFVENGNNHRNITSRQNELRDGVPWVTVESFGLPFLKVQSHSV